MQPNCLFIRLNGNCYIIPDIWICGYEFATHSENESDLEFNELPSPPYVGGRHWTNRQDFLKSQYNLKALKLLMALENKEVSLEGSKAFFNEHSCFDCNSNYFKLNIFPIGFPNTKHGNWPDWMTSKTGFSRKAEYLHWCSEHRFPVLRSWVSHYSPKLIICTGTKSCGEFQSAFGTGNEEVFTTEAADKQIKYFVTNNNRTLVAVTYFLGGPYGLISDKQLALTGKKLSELLKDTVHNS